MVLVTESTACARCSRYSAGTSCCVCSCSISMTTSPLPAPLADRRGLAPGLAHDGPAPSVETHSKMEAGGAASLKLSNPGVATACMLLLTPPPHGSDLNCCRRSWSNFMLWERVCSTSLKPIVVSASAALSESTTLLEWLARWSRWLRACAWWAWSCPIFAFSCVMSSLITSVSSLISFACAASSNKDRDCASRVSFPSLSAHA
mmetsp:Transcript_18403/g.46091  ORF Transcript_18403/g.46091 Transcript_18403/m.46091 type:complete len:204 (-) Transcript_18403:207-818(-)